MLKDGEMSTLVCSCLRTGSVEHLLSGGGCPSGFELCFPKCGNLILRFFNQAWRFVGARVVF